MIGCDACFAQSESDEDAAVFIDLGKTEKSVLQAASAVEHVVKHGLQMAYNDHEHTHLHEQIAVVHHRQGRREEDSLQLFGSELVHIRSVWRCDLRQRMNLDSGSVSAPVPSISR